MSWHWQQFLPLWPVAAVWLLLVLPYLASSSPALLANPQLDLPPWFALLLRTLIRLPFYRHFARMDYMLRRYRKSVSGGSLDFMGPRCWCKWDRPGQFIAHRPPDPHCTLCEHPLPDQDLLDHMLSAHWPDEERAWRDAHAKWLLSPPVFTSAQDAQQWLDKRTPHLALLPLPQDS